MEYIGIAAVVGCYLAIIGMYVWVFKQIQEVKKMITDHAQKSEIHTDEDKFVLKAACGPTVVRIEEKVKDIKETMKSEFKELKQLIKDSR